jgi:alpha-galactosidase
MIPRIPPTLPLAFFIAIFAGMVSAQDAAWDGAPRDREKEVVDSWMRNVAASVAGREDAVAEGSDIHPFTRELPFRFRLAEEDSRAFLGQWRYSASAASAAIRGGETRRHSWHDPENGLRLTWEVTTFENYPAVDWVLTFENTGRTRSPRIREVRAIDLVAGPVTGREARILHAARGGAPTGIAYQPLRADLAGGIPVRLEPRDGRSSNGYLPFFNLELGRQGVIIGLGWSGQWSINAAAEGPRVRLHGGQSKLDLRLEPGERIRSPRVLLVHWQGERLHGQNLWRRVLRDHYSPPLDGKRPLPFVQCNTWLPLRNGENATEEKLASYLNGYAGSGLEYLVMDAGWYGSSGKPWNQRTGSWIPNPQQFPRGLAPVGAAAKLAGIGFGLWFEPERVVPGTRLDMEHPDWILRRAAPRYRPDNPMLDAGLLDLGKLEVQNWLTGMIGEYVEQTPLAYFRHDFNHFDSIGFLRAADAPGRTGINEIRYAEGLYRVLDELRSRFPGLVMEGCASGGRRIDLETLRRNHLYWKADHIYGEPHHQQSTLFAGLHWLPGGFLNSTVLDLQEDCYALHSTFGGSLTVGWDPTQREPEPQAPYFKQAYDPALAKAQIASFKAVRHLFDGDFFPLTPYSPNPVYWLGWQFHRDDLDEGVAVIFRRQQARQGKRIIELQDLNPSQLYHLRLEGKGTLPFTQADGAALVNGFEVTHPALASSLLIHYQRENKP